MRTEFVLYSGLRTIGGVNASITYGNDRVIFEFGSAYDPKTDLFDGKLEKRDKNWLRDMLRIGLAPRIDGVYRKCDLGGGTGLAAAEDSPYNTAVFITHLHLDHMALINTLAPEVPVYMYPNAQKIEYALEATGEGAEGPAREYTDLLPGVAVRVGEIEVMPLQTSSRSYGDFAFFITTPDGTFHWTGDLTLHSEEQELTLRQMEYVKERKVDVMLCDCTSFMDNVMELMYEDPASAAVLPNAQLPAGMLSTEQYYAGLFENLRDVPGLCVFNFYQREMDEAQRFLEWAGKTNRTCVFEPDAAYTVYKFFGIRPHVYVPDSPRYPADAEKQSSWFKELRENSTLVTREGIAQNPGAYLLQNSYRHMLELLDLPGEGGVYLHADGIPIGEFDPAYANMQKLLAHTAFRYVTFFSKNFFGHGYPAQVKYFVDEIDPKVLIPCHSYNPERLLPKNGRQLLPQMNRVYVLENHDLVLVD